MDKQKFRDAHKKFKDSGISLIEVQTNDGKAFYEMAVSRSISGVGYFTELSPDRFISDAEWAGDYAQDAISTVRTAMDSNGVSGIVKMVRGV